MTVNLGKITLSQLRFVCAVVEEGTFRGAAKKCKVSQPTLSVQILKLERALTVDIFDRRMQPVQLTTEGKEIVAQAKTVLLCLNRFATLREENSQSLEGVLNIGIVPALVPVLAPDLASQFVRKYPKIELVIHEASTSQIRIAIERQKYDVGVLTRPLKIPHIEERFLYTEGYLCYFSAEHRLLEKERIEISDLGGEGSLSDSDDDYLTYSSPPNVSRGDRTRGAIRLQTSCVDTVKQLVDAENSYAIFPEFSIAHDLSDAEQSRLKKIYSQPQRAITMVNADFFNRRLLLSVLEREIVSVSPSRNNRV